MARKLTRDEQALWNSLRQVSEQVWQQVSRDIGEATDLSGTEFSVLQYLVDGGGKLRQQELADAMGWHKSRLSHQLDRTQARGYLRRAAEGRGVVVTVSAAGRRALEKARPAYEASVRRTLTGRLSTAQRSALRDALDALSDD